MPIVSNVTLVPLSTESDVNKAVDAASAAFDSWSSLAPRQRADYLFKIADKIDENLEVGCYI